MGRGSVDERERERVDGKVCGGEAGCGKKEKCGKGNINREERKEVNG